MEPSDASTPNPTGHSVELEGVQVHFPFQPYEIQKDFMRNVILCAKNAENGLLESPTGTGKTLSLLCSSLAWLRGQIEVEKAEIQARREALAAEQGFDFSSDFRDDDPTFTDQSFTDQSLTDQSFTDQSHGDSTIPIDDSDPVTEIAGPSHDANSSQELSAKPAAKPEVKASTERYKVIYASRTHKQLSQVMNEFKRTEYKDLLAVCLASREHYCVNDNAKRDKKTGVEKKLPEINAFCKEHKKTCRYFDVKGQKIDHLAMNIDTIRYENEETHSAVIDVEDLVKIGIARHTCPYFSAQTIATKTARVIFTPYNYLLEQLVNLSLENAVVIFDEGHNIESACEDSASGSLPSFSILNMAIGIEAVIGYAETEAIEPTFKKDKSTVALDIPTLKELCGFAYLLHGTFDSIFKKALPKRVPTYANSEPISYTLSMTEFCNILMKELKLTSNTVAYYAKEMDNLIDYLNSTGYSKQLTLLEKSQGGNTAFFKAMESFGDFFARLFAEESKTMDINQFTTFLQTNFRAAINEVKTDAEANGKNARRRSGTQAQGNKKSWLLNFYCMNPGVTINRLMKKGIRSIIISSGTLAPMDSFEEEMGIKFPRTLCNSHVIQEGQLMIFAVSNHESEILDGTYKNEQNRGSYYFQALGRAVERYVSKIPAGVLLFFKSYAAKTRCFDEWLKSGLLNNILAYKEIFHEPQNKEEFADALARYKETIDHAKGGIFAAVYRGKVSEGLDLANDYCRGAIIIGLPYPYLKDAKVALKRDYLMKRPELKLTSEKWYENQMLRAVNQAVGRIVRHKGDYGIVLLLDIKYESKRSGLSQWLHKFVRDTRECKSQRFDSFFRENANRHHTQMSLVDNLSAIEQSSHQHCNNHQVVISHENDLQLHPSGENADTTADAPSASTSTGPATDAPAPAAADTNSLVVTSTSCNRTPLCNGVDKSNVLTPPPPATVSDDEEEIAKEWESAADFICSLDVDEGQRPSNVEPCHKKMRFDHLPDSGDGVRAGDSVYTHIAASTSTSTTSCIPTTSTAITCCLSTNDSQNSKSEYEFDDSLDNIFEDMNVNEFNGKSNGASSSYSAPDPDTPSSKELQETFNRAYDEVKVKDWNAFDGALMKYKNGDDLDNFVVEFKKIFTRVEESQLKVLVCKMASHIPFTSEADARAFKVKCVGDE